MTITDILECCRVLDECDVPAKNRVLHALVDEGLREAMNAGLLVPTGRLNEYEVRR